MGYGTKYGRSQRRLRTRVFLHSLAGKESLTVLVVVFQKSSLEHCFQKDNYVVGSDCHYSLAGLE